MIGSGLIALLLIASSRLLLWQLGGEKVINDARCVAVTSAAVISYRVELGASGLAVSCLSDVRSQCCVTFATDSSTSVRSPPPRVTDSGIFNCCLRKHR